MVSVCLRGGGNAEQIEGVVLCAGRGGEDGGEVIAAEADDIAGERGDRRLSHARLKEIIKRRAAAVIFDRSRGVLRFWLTEDLDGALTHRMVKFNRTLLRSPHG